tara:strand:- start:9398 stop:10075 length:678 start_codon:yes stop_codon:yes gene_type:complete
MKTSESVKEILPALLSVTDSMQAEKDGKNPHFRSDYMTLDGILNTVKPILKDVGIVILQSIDNNIFSSDKATCVIECHTKLLHTSGEYIESKCIVHADKMTPQGYGSAITYVRRYGITTALGIAEADDDGNAAEVASAPKKPASKPKPVPINTKKVEPQKDALLSEEQTNKIIKVFDDIDVEIWDLEKIVGSHEKWTESTRVKLLASYNNIQNGIKSVEDFKAGK